MRFKHLFLIGLLLAVFALVSEDTEAYSYSYGWQNSYSSYGNSHPSDYQPRTTTYMPARWGDRYRGGIFVPIRTPSYPSGYQANTFNTGSSYSKFYKSQDLAWRYGTGQSDWYYDGGFRVQSKYYQYGY